MNPGALIVLALLTSNCAFARKPVQPLPSGFEIGRHTFFDFGPPFDYYEIIVVRSASGGARVERLLLTPAAGCFQPAKVELASASLSESVAELFGKTNPCSIPEKELRRELKRRKKYLVFSGADVSMHVKCGREDRVIRADILDRDMFNPVPDTPKNTSWTMQLLEKLDKSLGPGVMDKPIFPVSSAAPNSTAMAPQLISTNELAAGNYDLLFPKAPDKPSDLYKASRIHVPEPSIRLVSRLPIMPKRLVLPVYPLMAKLARVEGNVAVHFKIAADGSVTGFEYKAGPPLLRGATEDAVRKWTFPPEAVGQEIDAILEFKTNCPKQSSP